MYHDACISVERTPKRLAGVVSRRFSGPRLSVSVQELSRGGGGLWWEGAEKEGQS